MSVIGAQNAVDGPARAEVRRGAGPGATLVRLLCLGLVLTGLASRCAPLLNEGGRLLRQFPTEDGYLMLTIARNIALGRGMSVAAGTTPTNGTQPLMTLVYGAGFWLAGGEREGGVLAAHLISILCAGGAACMLYLLGTSLLGRSDRARAVSGVAASAWFGAALPVQHTMNMLETGAYVLMVLVSTWFFVRSWEDQRWGLGRCLVLGVILGVTFLVRNDAVFLILGACVTRFLCGWNEGRAAAFRRLGETLVFGAVSVVVALPWLYYNVSRFGSIMPISGTAESVKEHPGTNLPWLPSALLEYISVVGAVPGSMELRPEVIAAGVVAIIAALALAAAVWVRSLRGGKVRCAIGMLGIMGAGLVMYYGVFFGAEWFISRYLMPLSAPLALLTAFGVEGAFRRCPDALRRPGLIVTGVAALAVPAGLNNRKYRSGTDHMHFQVVAWVQEHLGPETWVGAPQTGTLGFFHDRTINFDGKVNPVALRAMLEGRSMEYVVGSRADYIVDWQGVSNWLINDDIRANFTLIVSEADEDSPLESRRRGLAVFRRKAGAESAAAQVLGVAQRAGPLHKAAGVLMRDESAGGL